MSSIRAVEASAPIRVCDNGGWTDTWFAGRGAVLNIAVTPRVEVRVTASNPGDRHAPVVTIDAANDGGRYAMRMGQRPPGRNPLLEAVIADAGVPDGVDVDIAIRSDAPAGASTGTSAAVAVALLAALDTLADKEPRDPLALARAAHRIEVERLGLQSGVQDQLCVAFGGVNFIEIIDYPHAQVTPVVVPVATWDALDRRLALVYLGRSHVSSAVHERVIRDVTAGTRSSLLEPLRASAIDARDALSRGDLAAFGRSLVDNTSAQAALHRDLVGRDAQVVIDVARGLGATGWKVNGAGGDGGSLTILLADEPNARDELATALAAAGPSFRLIPTALSADGVLARRVE